MATKLGPYKDVPLNLVGGMFDAQSAVGEIGPTNYRVVLNMAMTEEKKRCRMGGWVQYGRNSPFGLFNQDLHDQLLGCLFYNDSYTEQVSGGGGQAGIAYPYHTPEEIVGATVGPTTVLGTYEGYASDFYGTWPHSPVPNQPFIGDAQSGYPYLIAGPEHVLPNTGEPDYYLDSYYRLKYFSEEPGTVIPAYDWGEPFPVYSTAYNYQRTYCGDYLHYLNGCREPITLLYESVSDAGKRKLIAGTSSRLYLLNERTGNWRILADNLGPKRRTDACPCAGRPWSVAQVGNIVLFSNNHDPVLYWKHDTPPAGCDFWSADYVPDLLGLGIYKAKVLAQWQGFVFLGDVEVNGVKYPYRVYWSDFNSPLTWAPGGDSLALYTDLAAGERVDRIEPLGGQLRIYTSKGSERAIYEVLLVGGDEVFSVREIYRGPDGLAFRNSLVNIGDAHVFISEQDVLVLAEFDRAPRRVEWIHKAGGVILNGLSAETLKSFPGLSAFNPVNRNACDQVVGGLDSVRDVIWLSWPTDDNDCPNMSLALNLKYRSASLVDAGFTAFSVRRPDYSSALRDFMARYAGCAPELLDKEGEAYQMEAPVEKPAYLRNATDDPSLPADPSSVCTNLGGLTLEELCQACDVNATFLMASAADRTIKEFSPDVYYRETYIGPDSYTYCPYIARPLDAYYSQAGYYSMMQSDTNRFGMEEEKIMNRVAIDFSALPQAVPNYLYVQIGYSTQPTCMRWAETPSRPFACLTEKTDSEHEADNTRAAQVASFPTFRAGSYLSWRFYVSGTGGGGCFNTLTQHMRLKSGTWR